LEKLFAQPRISTTKGENINRFSDRREVYLLAWGGKRLVPSWRGTFPWGKGEFSNGEKRHTLPPLLL